MKDSASRSHTPIERDDLLRLLHLARADRRDYFARYPRRWGAYYADRVICTALCQGAALHYAFGEAGINDFDVYTFYAVNPERNWYSQRRQPVDFGDPKFGRSEDAPGYTGRRVDLMGRTLPELPDTDPVDAMRRYLSGGATDTARLLAEKAVVMLEPEEHLGCVVWPPEHSSRRAVLTPNHGP